MVKPTLAMAQPHHQSGSAPLRARSLSLRQNAWWSLLGNMVYAGCQLGMLVVLARLGSADQVGLYGWALAITTPAFLLASMQLRTVLAAEASGETRHFGDYLGSRLVTTTVVLLVLGIVAWRIQSFEARIVVLAVAIAKAIESVSDVLYGFFWQQDRMDCIAKSMMARGLLGVVGFALAHWWFGSLAAAQMMLAMVWLAMLLSYDLPQARRLSHCAGVANLRPNFRYSAMRSLIGLGLPAGILSGLTSLQVSVPRYFVEVIMGTSALGVFTALAFLFMGIELVARSVNYAAVPKFSRLIRAEQAGEVNRLVGRLTLFGVVMALAVIGGIAMLGRPLVGLLYGSEYSPYTRLLLYLAAISGVRILAMPLAMTLRSAQAYWQLTVVQGVSLLALASACWLFVPPYGLEGCALAVLVGLLVDIAGRCWCHFRILQFHTPVASKLRAAA